MERNVKAWLILAIYVMAFLASHITEGIRDVPNPTKGGEVYTPDGLLGGLVGPAWGIGLGLLPAILGAALGWPLGYLGFCCGGAGPGWLGLIKDMPHHKGDAAGGYGERVPKGGHGYGAFMASSNATDQTP